MNIQICIYLHMLYVMSMSFVNNEEADDDDAVRVQYGSVDSSFSSFIDVDVQYLINHNFPSVDDAHRHESNDSRKDIRLQSIESDDFSVITSTLINDDIESSCKSFIKVFAEHVANFTKCSVEYAQPIRVCENCVSQYALAINTFDILMVSLIIIITTLFPILFLSLSKSML